MSKPGVPRRASLHANRELRTDLREKVSLWPCPRLQPLPLAGTGLPYRNQPRKISAESPIATRVDSDRQAHRMRTRILTSGKPAAGPLIMVHAENSQVPGRRHGCAVNPLPE